MKTKHDNINAGDDSKQTKGGEILTSLGIIIFCIICGLAVEIKKLFEED